MPPKTGPRTLAVAMTAPMRPPKAGLTFSGAVSRSMTIVKEYKPSEIELLAPAQHPRKKKLTRSTDALESPANNELGHVLRPTTSQGECDEDDICSSESGAAANDVGEPRDEDGKTEIAKGIGERDPIDIARRLEFIADIQKTRR